MRTNLCLNPSFAYGTNGWARYAPSSLRIASDTAAWGGRDRQSPTYLAVDVPAQLQGQVTTPGIVPVAAGQALAVSALVRTSPGIGLAVRVEWTVGGRSQLASAPLLLTSSAEGDRPTWVHVAPPGATQARVRFEVRTSGARDNSPGWINLGDVMIDRRGGCRRCGGLLRRGHASAEDRVLAARDHSPVDRNEGPVCVA